MEKLTREQVEEMRYALITRGSVLSNAQANALCNTALASLAPDEGMVRVPREATDAEANAAARVIAASSLIDAPKLGPESWKGLGRAVANAVLRTSGEGEGK
jgi:hypothetical protein